MTSLRKLKKHIRGYQPHFGGCNSWGRRWTKQERIDALNDRKVWIPRVSVSDIIWDKEVDGEEQEVDLPTRINIHGIPEDEVADYLSDNYGYCVKSFKAEVQPISFPGYSN